MVAISYCNNYTIDRTFCQTRSTFDIHHLVTPIEVPLIGPLLEYLKSTEVGGREGGKERELEWERRDDQAGEELLGA